MPEFAISHLESYIFTVDERDRRLSLLDQFRPGEISDDLASALFWIEDEEEGLIDPRALGEEESPEMRGVRIATLRVQKKRRQYPWFEWMLKWGYPPGWVAGKGETSCHGGDKTGDLSCRSGARGPEEIAGEGNRRGRYRI